MPWLPHESYYSSTGKTSCADVAQIAGGQAGGHATAACVGSASSAIEGWKKGQG